MEFRDKQAIYLQIAEYVCEKILLKQWLIGDKILSIRDLASSLEVNPNTIQRTYDFLQQQNIIVNKRGIGYFVTDDAEMRVMDFRRRQFFEHELPVFFRNLYLLNLGFDDIKKEYEKYIQFTFKSSI